MRWIKPRAGDGARRAPRGHPARRPLPATLVFYAEEETAEILRCTVAHLQGLRWKRKGPKVTKRGRTALYRQSDLEAYQGDAPAAAR